MQIAIFGSYGQGNIGDEAIADGLSRIFHQAVPESSLILFSHLAPVLKDTHKQFKSIEPMIATGLRSLWQQLRDGTLKKSHRILKTTDWIIIGGGGILHDQEIGQRGLSPLFIWWLRTVYFSLLGKRIALAAVGVGPIKKKLSNTWLKGILKRTALITVRDEQSQHILKGLTTKVVTVVPDPVWGLFTPSTKILKGSATLGINIRENRRYSQAEMTQKLFQVIKGIQARTTIKDIKLIPFALHNPDDRDVMTPLISTLQDLIQLPVQIVPPQTTAQAFELVSQCDYFIATRFHSYILAQTADVPCELLSYSSKTDEITKHSKIHYLAQQQFAIQFWHNQLTQVD